LEIDEEGAERVGIVDMSSLIVPTLLRGNAAWDVRRPFQAPDAERP